MKPGFRFPIFFVLMLGFLAGCRDAARPSSAPKALLVQKGYVAQMQAETFEKQIRLDSALTYFAKARAHYENAPDSARTAYVLLRMANILRQYNDYVHMQALDVEALRFAGSKADDATRASIYTDLGISYLNLEDYGRAIANYEKALHLVQDEASRAILRNNIGYAHIHSQNYEKAVLVLEPMYRSISAQNVVLNAAVLDNLGYARLMLGRPDALPLLLRALHIRDSVADVSGQISSQLHLADFYARGQASQARSHALRALQLSQFSRAADDELLALDFLIRHPDGDLPRLSARYVQVSDSLRVARQKGRNHFAALRYDFRKEREDKLRAQAESAQARLQEATQRNEKTLWLMTTIAATLGLVAFYKISENRKWKSGYEAETRISRRLHDELANDMHQTMVFAETADFSKRTTVEQLLENLDQCYRRTRNISREHAAVATKENFVHGLRSLIAGYNSGPFKVLVTGLDGLDPNLLNEEKKVAVHRGVQELLVNMHKHSAASLAVVGFEVENNALVVTYSDNGKGAPASGLNKNGLQIMENRIQAFKGSVTFGSNAGKGFRAAIKIPL